MGWDGTADRWDDLVVIMIFRLNWVSFLSSFAQLYLKELVYGGVSLLSVSLAAESRIPPDVITVIAQPSTLNPPFVFGCFLLIPPCSTFPCPPPPPFPPPAPPFPLFPCLSLPCPTGAALTSVLLLFNKTGWLPIYFPCISLPAAKYSSPSLKLTKPYPLDLVVRLSLTTRAFWTEGYLENALSSDSSVTSPARLPTKRRKWAGSHSRRVLSVQVVPPPERWTVLAVLSLLPGVECEEGPTDGEAVSSREELPKGAVLAPVAPSRRGKPEVEEDLLSSLLT